MQNTDPWLYRNPYRGITGLYGYKVKKYYYYFIYLFYIFMGGKMAIMRKALYVSGLHTDHLLLFGLAHHYGSLTLSLPPSLSLSPFSHSLALSLHGPRCLTSLLSLSHFHCHRSCSRSLVLAVTALTITTLAVTYLLRYNRREQLPRHQLPTPDTKVGHQSIDWFTTLGEKGGGERGRREQGRGMIMRE